MSGFPYVFDFLTLFLFLIVSGLSLHFVASDGEYHRRTHRFRAAVIVLYGLVSIVILYYWIRNEHGV